MSLEEWIPAPYKLADFDYIDLKLQFFFGMVDEYERDASGLTIRGATPIPAGGGLWAVVAVNGVSGGYFTLATWGDMLLP